jgi:hypothetical protein
MTIDEAIKNLESAKRGGTKSIVFAWWSADMFGRTDDKKWRADSEWVENQMDWSYAHDQITDILNDGTEPDPEDVKEDE